jgi:hypothetical protein
VCIPIKSPDLSRKSIIELTKLRNTKKNNEKSSKKQP